ncbi:MAG: hypothetical protein Q9212_005442 [Teloschistes hypoglaucus]
MGKRGRGRGGGDRGRGRNAPRTDRSQRVDYNEVAKFNKLFEGYYNQLSIFEDDEKDDFWAALRRELPNSFRFAGSKR